MLSRIIQSHPESFNLYGFADNLNYMIKLIVFTTINVAHFPLSYLMIYSNWLGDELRLTNPDINLKYFLL